MRRHRIPRNFSAHSLCIFCACRLGVDVPSTSIVSSTIRPLSTSQSQRREAAPAPSSYDIGNDGKNTSAAAFKFDSNSTLTRSEQQERARRLALRQEQEIRDRLARQELLRHDQEARLHRQQPHAQPRWRRQQNLPGNDEARGIIRKYGARSEGTTLSEYMLDNSQRRDEPVENDGIQSNVVRASRGRQQLTRKNNNVGNTGQKYRIPFTRYNDSNAQSEQPTASSTPNNESVRAGNPNIQNVKMASGELRQNENRNQTQIQPRNQNGTNRRNQRSLPDSNARGPARVGLPTFLRASESDHESQQMTGWGMGTTETRPLGYADDAQPGPRLTADGTQTDYHNSAVESARDAAHVRNGEETASQRRPLHDVTSAPVNEEQRQETQRAREVHGRQITTAREYVDSGARSIDERQERQVEPALESREERARSAPESEKMQAQRASTPQQRSHDTDRRTSSSQSGAQRLDVGAQGTSDRRPQLYFSMSDAQEYKYDRDYANHESYAVTTRSGGTQNQPFARPEARVPMSNRYEAPLQDAIHPPHWPSPLPTFVAGSERDEYNPEYRISESRSSRTAQPAYQGNWSSFEDEQYGDAVPDPAQRKRVPPPGSALEHTQHVPQHYGDEIPHSEYGQAAGQREQGEPSGLGLDDSYDGIPLDAAQRRPEPHPTKVGQYPRHVPRNARTFGFEDEHRRDPFYAEKPRSASRVQTRNEAPPPSRFSGSFQKYENIQYDNPVDHSLRSRTQQYQRPFMGAETFGSFESDDYYESQYQYPNSQGQGPAYQSAPQQLPPQSSRLSFGAPHYHQDDQRRGGFGYDSFESHPPSSQPAQQYQDYDRRGVSQPFGDSYGPPDQTHHNDNDDGGQASFYDRQPAPYRSGGSGYRAEPIDPNELGQNLSSTDVDNSANWQHLRRKDLESVTPPAQYQAHSPRKQALSNQEIDRMFANHVQQRETHYPSPSPMPPPPDENSRIKFIKHDFGDSSQPLRRCARCGETGHLARDCSGPRQQITPRESAIATQRQDYGPSIRRFEPSVLVEHQSRNASYKPASESAGLENSDQAARYTKEIIHSVGEEPSKRSSRRDRWTDREDDMQREDDHNGKRRERRGARRPSNDGDDKDDEHQSARDEYRARKAQRQSKEEADRQANAKAARKERSAQKAGEATPVILPEFISVQNLSQVLGVRYEQFVEHLEELGYDDVFPGKTLNSETSGMIAMEYNFEPIFDTSAREEEERELKPRPEVTDKDLLPARPPVVTIMGHVDHGKTTILDYLRKSSIAAGEAGGITQHIGAFSVPLASSGKTITFLDTPGHAAFLAMRQRGANVTDIVILVVAADDSVKPQTLEALKHAKAAGVPIIVAINKVDKEEADVERCKQDLSRHGVDIEDYGGDTQVVCVSGKTGRGMDELEETVVTLSEILDHRAETDGAVEGWVLEATTKKAGRVATVLVRRGTLRPGSVIVAGKTWARVKTLRNEAGKALTEVGAGMPVEVDGWKDQPMAGDEVLQAPSEQKANSVVAYRLELAEREKTAQDTEAINESRRIEQQRRGNEKAAEQAAKRAARVVEGSDPVLAPSSEHVTKTTESGQMVVPFIIKADVSGSVEAVSAYILSVSNPLIAPQILQSSVGAVHESDIELANAAQGHIIAFNLASDPDMKALGESRGVRILENNIIYRVLDDVKSVLEEKLPPIVTQRVLGEAEISASFEISIGGRKKVKIAGCKVRNGVVARNARVRVTRNGETIYDGTIDSLKNVKKDVQEMRKGSECGMGFENWEGFETSDQIQTYVEIEEKRKL